MGLEKAEKTNKSRGKLAIAKDYKAFAGEDIEPPNADYFNELKKSKQKIK